MTVANQTADFDERRTASFDAHISQRGGSETEELSSIILSQKGWNIVLHFGTSLVTWCPLRSLYLALCVLRPDREFCVVPIGSELIRCSAALFLSSTDQRHLSMSRARQA